MPYDRQVKSLLISRHTRLHLYLGFETSRLYRDTPARRSAMVTPGRRVSFKESAPPREAQAGCAGSLYARKYRRHQHVAIMLGLTVEARNFARGYHWYLKYGNTEKERPFATLCLLLRYFRFTYTKTFYARQRAGPA